MEASERISFKGIGQVLKLPAVWIIGIVTFCNYVLTLSLYYFTPYATGIIGATVTFAATLAALKRWFGTVSSVAGGFLTDKIGTGQNHSGFFPYYGCRYRWNFAAADPGKQHHRIHPAVHAGLYLL